ncbi:GGDEF domain-containing protein [Aureimonas sp. OT7]|uniref:GGDEF domain-containing protein n=1 Tax=Aureimonas sp. OT7 TaxID=2816454 RepID=UPI00177BFF8B|nr:GGDEF domain-containing protein [Aureimonas sp. OT7]QOG05572.1 GGDEF domain-containing protein [Aureimonas sp. OT7]
MKNNRASTAFKGHSLPKTAAGRWLGHISEDAPLEVRDRLLGGLYGTIPIFLGGVANTVLVSAFIAIRIDAPRFYVWVCLEIAICLARVYLLIRSRRLARLGRDTHTDGMMMLSLAWAAGVGYGSFICLLSGDWVASTMAMMSSAAMIGGICIRNFGTPRLASAMMVLAFGPACFALPFTGEPLLLLGLVQIPFYILSMCRAAYVLKSILVATMIAERQHALLSRHDALTGLLNRVGLAAELRRIAARAAGSERLVAFMYMDLDGFKAVNDDFGHDVGDAVLSAAADRLQEHCSAEAGAARIGGDEFVFICLCDDEASADRMALRLMQDLRAPYDVAGVDIHFIGVSIGIAFAEPDTAGQVDLKPLLRAADSALYAAKRSGKGKFTRATDPV